MLEPNVVYSPRHSPRSMVTIEASPLISRKSTPSDDSMSSGGESNAKKRSRYVLISACFIPFGAHYAKQMLPPLRPLFQAAGTDSYTFGLLLSAAAWPNLLQPFLAGLFLDTKGHEQGAIVFSTLALIGHSIFSASVGPTGVSSEQLPTALIGRALFGLGSGGSGIVQGAIIGHHAEEDITLAVGIAESLKYMANFLGKATPVPIVQWLGREFGVALWFGSLLLLFSCVVAVAYAVGEEVSKPFTFALNTSSRAKSPSRQHSAMSISTVDTTTSQIVVVDERSYFQISRQLIFSLSWSFWAISWIHLLLSNTHNLFAGFSTSYMVETFGLSPQHAAWIASLDAFVPIFVAPLIGKYVDRHGGRMTLCIWASVIDCLSFALLIVFGESLPLGPIIPMIMISLATSATPSLVKACVPIVAPREALGTAFSLYSVSESLGASVGHVGLGYLRDRSMNYTKDLMVMFLISLAAGVATAVVRWLDAKHLNGILEGNGRS